MNGRAAAVQRHLRVVRTIDERAASTARTRSAGAPSSEWYQPSYGIDFKFLRVHEGVPIRWLHGRILVRLVGPHPEHAGASLSTVVAEIAGHSGLDLVVAEPDPRGDPYEPQDFVVPSEIRVAHRSFDKASGSYLAHLAPTVLGVGGAVVAGRDVAFSAGHAVLDPARIGDDPGRHLGVLRHELGHAVGLAHPARASTLMYAHAVGSKWQLGDIAGLRLLGRRELPAGYAPSRSQLRPSALCGTPE